MTRLRMLRDEQEGVSLAELVVAMSIGLIVLLGVFAVVQVSTHSSNRTTSRVVANQTARPVLTRIIDELHSSCISPGLAPIQTGSGPYSMTFIYSTKNGVTPEPSKLTISLTSGIISESVYTYSSGSAPTWTFSATPATTRLMVNASDAVVGGASVPLFRYYAYDSNGLVSTTPLTTPLSDTDAGLVVKVSVAFKVTPPKTTVNPDTAAALSLADSVLLRFTPGSTTSGENTPCG